MNSERDTQRYLNKIGAQLLSSFEDTKEITRILTSSNIGDKFYIMFETYNDIETIDYIIRPATFMGIGKNYNTGTKEFNFIYEKHVYASMYKKRNQYIPQFANSIGENNFRYTLYSFPSPPNNNSN